MQTIHQGIGFRATVKLYKQFVADALFVALRNPAGAKLLDTAPEKDAVVYADSVELDGSLTQITIYFGASKTKLLPIGNYSLEVYDSEKSEMAYFVENYAVCRPSTGTDDSATKADVTVNEDETTDGLTLEEIRQYIDSKPALQ